MSRIPYSFYSIPLLDFQCPIHIFNTLPLIIATARLRNSLLHDMQYDKFRSLVTPDLGVHLLPKDGLLNRGVTSDCFVVNISVRDVREERLAIRLVFGRA